MLHYTPPQLSDMSSSTLSPSWKAGAGVYAGGRSGSASRSAALGPGEDNARAGAPGGGE